MAALQSEADFMSWGWRVPFLLSAVLIGVGWWVRTTVEESPAFAEVRRSAEKSRAPALEAIRTRPRELAVGAGLRMAENISYYIITAFSITYVTEIVGLTRQAALNALLIGAAVHFCAIPAFGALSDRIGRRPVYAFGASGAWLWAFAFFPLLDKGSGLAVTGAVVIGLILHAAMYGPRPPFSSKCSRRVYAIGRRRSLTS